MSALLRQCLKHRQSKRISLRLLSSLASPLVTNTYRSEVLGKSIRKEMVKIRTAANPKEEPNGFRSKLFSCKSTNQIRTILSNLPGCDVASYSAAIQQAGRLRDVQCCLDIMELMRSRNVIPDVVVYATLCHALKINARMDLFDEYLNEMINVHHIEPNIVLATTLLSGCVSQGNVKRAQQIWKDIILKYKLRPNTFTLNLMIEMLGQSGDIKKAKAIYDKLIADPSMIEESGIKSHSVMIKAFIQNDDIEGALEIKQYVESLGQTLNAPAYAPLITFYVKQNEYRNPHRALELIEECIDRNKLNVIPEQLIHLKCISFHHLMAEEEDAVKRKEYFEIVKSEPQQRSENGHSEWGQRVANNVFDAHLVYYRENVDHREVIRCFESIEQHLGYWNTTYGEHKREKYVLDLHGWSYISAKFLLHHLLTKRTDELVANMGFRWEIICGKQSTTKPSSKDSQAGLSALIRKVLDESYGIFSRESTHNTGKLHLSEKGVKMFLEKKNVNFVSNQEKS